MCELQIINNQNFGQVRFLQIGNKFYAVASDVAKSLGYDQPHKAIARHCKGERNVPSLQTAEIKK